MTTTARRRLPTVAAVTPFQRTATGPVERCGPNDLLHDYVLEAYAPRAPQLGKLRSVNLLFEAFALAGVEREGVAWVNAIRDGLGPFRTVFGVKHDAKSGIAAFELYFYDFGRKHADLSLDRVVELSAPHVTVEGRLRSSVPWHMFSVEVRPEDLRDHGRVPAHVYVDMRSYLLSDDTPVFENVYTFHDPRAEIDHVLTRLRGSLHSELSGQRLAAVVPPELFRCHRMCVANKRTSDAVYFSRVTTEAMMRFLSVRGWPEVLQQFVQAHRGELDHLFWCLGQDFRGSEPVTTKSGVYGSF